MKNLIIYHNQDMDGIMCRWIIEQQCKYHGHQFKSMGLGSTERRIELDSIVDRYDYIIIADFSLESDQMSYLARLGKLVWIDHHYQAIEDSKKNGYDRVGGLRSEDKSAAWLALEFYEKSICQSCGDSYDSILRITDLVDIRDRWDTGHDLFDEAKKFNSGIMSLGESDAITWLNQTIYECEDHDEEIEHMISIGQAVTNSKEHYSKGFAKPHVAFIDGNLCIAYNFIHNELSDSVEENAICMMYVIQDKTVKVSLRSKSDRYNVAAIAAKYGGGGHRRAAGFNCSIKQLFEFLEH